MAYQLDTCALSEFTKPKPSASVDAWFAKLPEGADFVSVLTLGELEKGIAKLATLRRRASLEKWFGDLRDRFDGRILVVDEPVALEWGRVTAQEGFGARPRRVTARRPLRFRRTGVVRRKRKDEK